MIISGTTRTLGLIGNPVEHTLSPVIHNTISELMSDGSAMKCVYVPFHVEEKLGDAVKGAHALNILGMNVTVPHKQDVMEYLSSVDDAAAVIGAVNTLVREENGYRGLNTDAEGISRELDFYGIEIEGKTVLMLGAGGASKAVAYALAKKNAGKVYICNRTLAKAQQIADCVNAHFGRDCMSAMTYEKISEIEEDELVAIQCTSVGLSPRDDECVIPDGDIFDKIAVGVDLVYKPAQTQFMKYLRAHGKPAYNGLRMLLYQGIAAYEHFTGDKVPQEVCEIAARRLEMAAGIRRPIILCGYMGSGKSTVARELSRKLGIPVIDTDERIVKTQGKSINDIFAQQGETAFRDMETELIKELIREEAGGIISLGGGMVLREENRKLLRALGPVVFLEASPEVIYKRVSGNSDRPLLAGDDLMGKIESMLKIRTPLYKDAAGICVDTDGINAAAVAECIINKLM